MPLLLVGLRLTRFLEPLCWQAGGFSRFWAGFSLLPDVKMAFTSSRALGGGKGHFSGRFSPTRQRRFKPMKASSADAQAGFSGHEKRRKTTTQAGRLSEETSCR